MVKQYVCRIKVKTGLFDIYMTGNSKFYLFRAIDPTGTYGTGFEFPIKKTDLKRGWKQHIVVWR